MEQLTDFIKTQNGLYIVAKAEIHSLINDQTMTDEQKFLCAIEWHLCNGWDMICGESIGLTECDVLSEDVIVTPQGEILDVGDYYHNMDWYQVVSPYEKLIREGYVEFALGKS